MKAAVFIEHTVVVDERPTPDPGPGDVRLRVHAAGLNAADLLQRRGFYPAPPGWPADIPGMEAAGVVEAVGPGVSSSLLGQRVCALLGGGGQATHCLVPATHCLELPDTVSFTHAGGFAEAFVTAYDALISQARLQAGERVVISGASGGVGTAAVQLARLHGAHVIAVTRTLAHHDHLRALGAHEVIALEDVSALEPVDVVLELVGAAHLELVQRRLAPYARVVVIGVGGGSRVEFDLLQVMATRATVTGSTLRSRSTEEKSDVIARVRAALVPAWARDELKVPLAGTFELDAVAQAYDFFAQPGKFGKVVIRTADE